MVGKIGYGFNTTNQRWSSEVQLMQYLKANYSKIEVRRFFFKIATGGAGATIAINEHTGSKISYEDAGAQVYIRASANNAAYDTESITIEYYDSSGNLNKPGATVFDVDNSTTEVAVDGATDFYRLKSATSTVTPGAGEHFIICDADADPAGGGDDVWGMIEENNQSMIDANFFVGNDATYRTFLADVGVHYECIDVTETCTVTATLTPKATAFETTIPITVYGVESFHKCLCMELDGATDVTFAAVDDADTGGNIVVFYKVFIATL